MDQHVTVGPFIPTVGAGAYRRRAFWSAFLGYMFDCMDLNIFTLILVPSMSELMQTTDQGLVLQAGSFVIAIKLICWGIGGVLSGVVADRFGRAPVLVSTIVDLRSVYWSLRIGPNLAGARCPTGTRCFGNRR